MASIRQRVTLPASPHDVYECLMDSRKHAKVTGAAAKISRSVGGSFSAGRGWIKGKNLELVKDKKIVQSWVAADFPKGHESKITISLKRVPSGTQLSFYHSNVPAKNFKGVKSGWTSFYWAPMKKFFA